MTQDRIIIAIGRIERALSRIESAAARPSPPSAEESEPSDLAERHETLRAEARRAIGDIDDLLKGLG